jgi:hypothetical protein
MVMNILIVLSVTLIANIFLGRKRIKYRKFTLMWWLFIHASILLIIPLRICLDVPVMFTPFLIGAAIVGQLLGSRTAKTKQKKN